MSNASAKEVMFYLEFFLSVCLSVCLPFSNSCKLKSEELQIRRTVNCLPLQTATPLCRRGILQGQPFFYFYMALACCVHVYMVSECAHEQHVRRTLTLTLTLTHTEKRVPACSYLELFITDDITVLIVKK